MIEQGRELRIENVLSFRKKVLQNELNTQMENIGKFLSDNSLKKVIMMANTMLLNNVNFMELTHDFTELSNQELMYVDGGVNWNAIKAGVAIVALGVAIAATAGLATVPIAVIDKMKSVKTLVNGTMEVTFISGGKEYVSRRNVSLLRKTLEV